MRRWRSLVFALASVVAIFAARARLEGAWSYEITSDTWNTSAPCSYGICSPWCAVVPNSGSDGLFTASCWEMDGKYPDYIRVLLSVTARSMDTSWRSWIASAMIDAASAQALDLLAALRPTAVWITLRSEEYGQTRTSLQWTSGPCPRDHDDSRGWNLANWSGEPWVLPDGVLYVLPETTVANISFDLTLWDGGCDSGNDDPVYQTGRVFLECRAD